MQLINASATGRFADGCDTEPLAQAKKHIKPAYDWAIRNLDTEFDEQVDVMVDLTHNDR